MKKSPCGLRSALFFNDALNVFFKERIHVNRFDLLTHLEFVSKRRHTHTPWGERPDIPFL